MYVDVLTFMTKMSKPIHADFKKSSSYVKTLWNDKGTKVYLWPNKLDHMLSFFVNESKKLL